MFHIQNRTMGIIAHIHANYDNFDSIPYSFIYEKTNINKMNFYKITQK
jgi:hypothetical protein